MMEQFKGKVVIVTGASAGIGAGIAKALVEAGMIVVGIARRKQKIEELAKRINAPDGHLHAVKADMTKEEDIVQAFKWTSDNVGPIHVLINNAGVAAPTNLRDGDTKTWRTAIYTNVLGVTIAAREAIKIMKANSIDGHIININSVVGHRIPDYSYLSVYPASKFAVTALTETLRLELIRLGSKIKVTSLSPGVVITEIFEKNPQLLEDIKENYKQDTILETADIANAVKYILATPPYVQVTELMIQSVGEPI